MESDTESSSSYLVIITKKDRIQLFCKIYWKILLVIITPLIFLPMVFLGNTHACWYVFIISAVYWIFDALHPGVISLIPIALFSLIGLNYHNFIGELHIHNGVLNCLGVMMLIIAIEHSHVHKRIALKVLLVFGCSHYRLSFLLFFICMFLSMWVSNTMACGLMMPLVKAILHELEKMGILEVYHNLGGERQKHIRHGQIVRKPTEFTIFYFLGIAYSSSIGGMTSLTGSQTNQMFKYYLETIFPNSPRLVYPNFILLTLPGVLIMETCVYLWLNFYFMGMFRAHSEMALEIGITEEESEYIETLLTREYIQLSKISFHEIIISVLVILTVLLQATRIEINGHLTLWSPVIVCILLCFIVPVSLDFLKFFKRRSSSSEEPFPTAPSKTLLHWSLIEHNMHWSILLVIGGSCAMFEALRMSKANQDVEDFLLMLRGWPAPAQAFVIIVICKVLTEFAPNSCVLYNIMPCVAKLSFMAKVNPLYLMTTATMASTMPFHLIPGSPHNAMVMEYAEIPPWKMMKAGIGPSIVSVIIIWFTTTLWSRVLWPDINMYPHWADINSLLEKNM